ncbi:MAG: argininosuccinate lyase [Alphaproteobacteria bacterium]
MGEQKNKQTSQMWGGRFSAAPSDLMQEINASIDYDKQLYKQDIKASIAHAQMLESIGILSQEEYRDISQALQQIEQEITSSQFSFRRDLEDIHMNVENRLKEIIGEGAGRLHTARSRNDQVAVDIRLWVRDAIDSLDENLKLLQTILIEKAEEYHDAVMAGFTHLQVAQPITLGHWMLAFVEMFARDRSRLKDCRKRLNENPLGSAALAGTGFPINRDLTSKLLDFDGPTRNSLDSVSDRDFAIEYLSVLNICAIHLSRMAEELVIWSSAQFNFIRLSDDYSTGSSIMPQKRNPDAAELIRARIGRILGSLVNLTTVMKGLPLAYGKDMQEDKEPVFDAHHIIMLSVEVMARQIEGASFNLEQLKRAAAHGFSTATDLADWCVRELRIPFRKAHHITGSLVKMAEDKHCELWDLSLEEMQSVEPKITDDIYNVLSVEKSVASRTSFGGTAPNNVLAAAKAAKKQYL